MYFPWSACRFRTAADIFICTVLSAFYGVDRFLPVASSNARSFMIGCDLIIHFLFGGTLARPETLSILKLFDPTIHVDFQKFR